jgi:hypothetical protein
MLDADICFASEQVAEDVDPTEVYFSSRRTPLCFRRFFETAKAKPALCDNRVRLSKNATAFLCVARDHRGDMGGSPMRVFFRFRRSRNSVSFVV